MEFSENCIEFITGESVATVTLTQRARITQFKKLAERFPEKMDYIENKDGSLCGHIPAAWVKFRAPNNISEEERARLSRNAKNSRKNGTLFSSGATEGKRYATNEARRP